MKRDRPSEQNNLFSHYQLRKKFTSKKNKVYLIRTVTTESESKDYVRKEMGSKLTKEAAFLLKLRERGVCVPELYQSGPDYLILEYLPGPTLLEIYCRLESEQADLSEVNPLFQGLSNWLLDFYRSYDYKFILGDINFRNFIVLEKNKIFGLDFEDCRKGAVEEDIGKLCAFGLTYRPVFTNWKLRVITLLFQDLTEKLSLDRELTRLKLKEELAEIGKRRRLSLSKIQLEDYLKNF